MASYSGPTLYAPFYSFHLNKSSVALLFLISDAARNVLVYCMCVHACSRVGLETQPLQSSHRDTGQLESSDYICLDIFPMVLCYYSFPVCSEARTIFFLRFRVLLAFPVSGIWA